MKIISVEGIIGAGKTTYINELMEKLTEEGYAVVIAKEPIGKWEELGIFNLFYDNIVRYAYTFQTFVFQTRVESLINAYKSQVDIDIIITERTPYTDRYVFMETLRKKLDPVEGKLYDTWCDMWLKMLPQKMQECDWYGIFINTSVGTCGKRILQRGRKGEQVDASYQEELEQSHIKFMSEFSPYKKTVVIDGELSTNHNERILPVLKMLE